VKAELYLMQKAYLESWESWREFTGPCSGFSVEKQEKDHHADS